jgi:hypothetical protein
VRPQNECTSLRCSSVQQNPERRVPRRWRPDCPAQGEFSWQLWIFAIVPDLPLIFGGGPGLQPGQLNPKAVAFYNATHRLAGPVLLTLAALISIGLGSPNGQAFLAGGLVWTAHILLDRGLGYGLRTAEGFQR